MSLTAKEREVLNVIKENVVDHGYPPSVREIAQQMGWASSSTVHMYVQRLVDKGYLRKDPSKTRALEVIEAKPETVVVPLLGSVAAGSPILAVEELEELIPVSKSLIGEGDFFALRIQGLSMIGAGILDEDTVIVRRQSDVDNGQIAVALIEDEVTVKRFFREADQIRLQPENAAMDPIIVDTVTVLGKVVAVLRKVK